jgi:uncharacterized membrane protein
MEFARNIYLTGNIMTLAFETSPSARAPKSDKATALSSNNAVQSVRARIASIDLLRGLVMIVMALDHTRDFFTATGFNPRDVTDPALFLTRWITHFCAPTFIFLAGISAFLYGAQGRSTNELSRYLATRGLWLILIEFTVVRLGWTFSLDVTHFITQVIFAIGASMVALALFIHLPRWAIAAIALSMIGGHNLLDGIRADQFGAAAPLWNFLHQPARLKFGDVRLFASYPLIPWIGVMAAGYAMGPIFKFECETRLRWLVGLGASIMIGFVLLRASNLYGDPAPWVAHESWSATVLSFINCEKYPPSLLYLAMTIGPALLLLAAFESAHGWVADRITTYGRVPFFYYVAHLFLIHTLAILFALATIGRAEWLVGSFAALKPKGLWARTARRLRRLVRDCCGALSAVPLVCGYQAAAQGVVVELSLAPLNGGKWPGSGQTVTCAPAGRTVRRSANSRREIFARRIRASSSRRRRQRCCAHCQVRRRTLPHAGRAICRNPWRSPRSFQTP